MRRSYPKFPLPGVGALIFKRRKILLCQRAGNPLKGWWSLPGGLVETGESLEDAVRREVLEETGLIIGQVSFFEIFERIMRDARGRAKFHYILVEFVFTFLLKRRLQTSVSMYMRHSLQQSLVTALETAKEIINFWLRSQTSPLWAAASSRSGSTCGRLRITCRYTAGFRPSSSTSTAGLASCSGLRMSSRVR